MQCQKFEQKWVETLNDHAFQRQQLRAKGSGMKNWLLSVAFGFKKVRRVVSLFFWKTGASNTSTIRWKEPDGPKCLHTQQKVREFCGSAARKLLHARCLAEVQDRYRVGLVPGNIPRNRAVFTHCNIFHSLWIQGKKQANLSPSSKQNARVWWIRSVHVRVCECTCKRKLCQLEKQFAPVSFSCSGSPASCDDLRILPVYETVTIRSLLNFFTRADLLWRWRRKAHNLVQF